MAESFDDRLRDGLEEDFEGMLEEMRKAMTSTVKARLQDDPCEKCGCKHIRYLEVPDFKTKIQLAEWWSNRAEGRPGQKSSEDDSDKIVFQRLVEMPEDDGDSTAASAA